MRIATNIITTIMSTVSTSNSFTEKFHKFQILGLTAKSTAKTSGFYANDIGFEAFLLNFISLLSWVVCERLLRDDSIFFFTPSLTAWSFFHRFCLT